MSTVHVFEHPLIQHKLSILRDKTTSVKEFRELVGEIAMLMCFEATRDLPLEDVAVETPVATAHCRRLAGKKLAVVPILRAGLGMVDGMVAMIPSAKVGHIGLYRDPSTLDAAGYRGAGSHCGGPHAGHRRQRHRGGAVFEGHRGAAYPVYAHHRRAGGRTGDAESPPGCGYFRGGAG